MSKLLITDFGAKDGELCTESIQRALDASTSAGGETVVIPKGTFISGALNLGKSSLKLEKGAVLKGSPNLEHYPSFGYTHAEMGDTRSLIYALDAENIRIYGEGTIDFDGDNFFAKGNYNVPQSRIPLTQEQIEECTLFAGKRVNQPMFFLRCKNLKLEGITLKNAPCWTITFCECQNVKVLYLTIENSLNIPNNDGIHVCSSKGVIIHGCHMTCGDDCIAVSCITDWNVPCEDVVISDCILKSCSKAIVVGYMHSIVRNVVVTNCIIKESNRGFTVMTSAGTSLVEHVRVTNLRIDTKIRAGGWWGNGEPIAVFSTYHNMGNRQQVPDRNIAKNIRDVHFENISCTAENIIGVVGQGKNMENVTFNNISMELKESKNLGIKGRIVDIAPSPAPPELPQDENQYWLLMKDVSDVNFKNITVPDFRGQKPKVHIADCENVLVDFH
jgi:polygalacturonase